MSLRRLSFRGLRGPLRPEQGPIPVPHTRRQVGAVAAVVLLGWGMVAGAMVVPGVPEQGAGPGVEAEISPRGVVATAVEPGDLDAVAARMDGAIAEAMAQQGIPGGVLVLVADGAIAYAQGYGTPTWTRTRPSTPNGPASTSARSASC